MINIHISTKVINPVYRPYLQDTHRYQIFYGGSSSGKSYFLAQRCIIDMLQGGHNYLICRKVGNTIRKSTFNEVVKAISRFKVASLFAVNKSDLVITGPNGYQVMFAGLDDSEKIKSVTPAKGVITDIWVEEATEAEKIDILQLDKRLRGVATVPKRLIMSFNPIYQLHWIYQSYFAGHWSDATTHYEDDMTAILKTTYLDNSFLMDDDKAAMEATSDPYYRSVYVEGNWGSLGHIIFTNWSTEDLSDKEFDSYLYGCDFGFANDPTALIECHLDTDRRILYVTKAEYLKGYTNDLVAASIQNLMRNPHDVIYCDSAEPKSIQELRQYRIPAQPAPKGPDSINFGIRYLQSLRIIVDKTLLPLINELSVYSWREDKDGNAIPKPVDRDNHLLDALRYALCHEMRNSGYHMSYDQYKWPTAGAM